ncbi:alpha-2-macroglobulin-like protein 1, partial [Macrochelys suwanniensis]
YKLHCSSVLSAPCRRYLIIIPAELTFPSVQRVCLDLRGVEKPIRVALTLLHASRSLVLFRRVIRNNRILECAKFWVSSSPAGDQHTMAPSLRVQVPSPAGGLAEVCTVQLTISNGRYFNVKEEKKVLIRRGDSSTFVQTDKPIYTPGQKVKFRILTLNEEFVPLNSKDPNSNRIGQWLDVRPRQGIVDLSFQLADEPSLGTYTINVANTKASSTFSVEEYVLPKFEVFFEGPTQIYALDKTFLLHVCGRYTYGRAVQGTIRVTLCQKAWRYKRPTRHFGTDICEEYSGQTTSRGCFSTPVNMAVFNLTSYEYESKLSAEASLVEDGTGVQINASSQFCISRTAVTATFEKLDDYYIPGVPYRGKIKLQDHHGDIMKSTKVYLVISYMGRRFNKTYITDGTGRASFNMDTTAWNSSSVSLEVSPEDSTLVFMNMKTWNQTAQPTPLSLGRFKLEDLVQEPGKINIDYVNTYQYLQPFHVTTKSFLKIHPLPGTLPCGLQQNVQVTFILSRKDLGEGASRMNFAYYVTGKAGIVVRGQKKIRIGKLSTLKGSFSIPLTFTSDFTPTPSLVVYAIFPSKGVAADSIQFDVAMCFKNQVKMGFSAKETLPGSTVQLQLQAASGSVCAVRAVDKSVLLTRPEKELSNQTVYELFPFIHRHGYPHQVEEYPDLCVRLPPLLPLVSRRPWYPYQPDVFNLFRSMGLKIFSNLLIKKPTQCYYPVNKRPTAPPLRPIGILEAPPESTILRRVRQYFPETWLWDLISVGPTGNRDIPVMVPDTITEWKAGMFCLAGVGFGLAPTTSLVTFQPFFVDMSLPYSVVRGETFTLKATVFNYLQQCIQIQVSLAKSSAFRVELCRSCRYIHCLCVEESRTFSWSVTATTLGKAGTVVEGRPEGVLVEKAHSCRLCPRGGNTVKDPMSLTLPANVVKGSARATISVFGDIMGMVLQNLDRLVQMPRGCGEQNMVLFAPIIYVLQYLEKTRQLTPEIRERATGFLRSGYQRQLLYKHSHGAYSAFGKRDREGNTWLTAFVVKSFGQAKKSIFIDDKNIQDALKWLELHQLPSGCFTNKGRLFHSSMKGGVNDEISLGAYITVALLELGQPLKGSMVQAALRCLIHAVHSVTNIYTEAVLAYAFALAGDYEVTQELLYKLDEQAIKSGGQIHWSPKPSSPASTDFWPRTQSVDVELTAYVLLAYLSKPRMNAGDMANAAGIVAWLARQQNARGGFASTQDTVVALQALAKYAAQTFRTLAQVTVTVKSKGSFERKFQVTHKNRLLLQQAVLAEIPGEFSVQAQGSGCIYAQTVLRYNEPPPRVSVTFSLRVTTQLIDCAKGNARFLTVRIHVRGYVTASFSPCLQSDHLPTSSYIGSRVTSNMVIVEVSLLSGFSLASSSHTSLQQRPLVRKTEVKIDAIFIYLEKVCNFFLSIPPFPCWSPSYLHKLSDESQTFILQLEQEIEVKGLKPANIKVYDYYQPEEQALADYNAVCS